MKQVMIASLFTLTLGLAVLAGEPTIEETAVAALTKRVERWEKKAAEYKKRIALAKAIGSASTVKQLNSQLKSCLKRLATAKTQLATILSKQTPDTAKLRVKHCEEEVKKAEAALVKARASLAKAKAAHAKLTAEKEPD